jgi:hypothetical protein
VSQRPKRTIKLTEKARESDLKRKCPDTSDTSITADLEDENLEADDFTDVSDDESDAEGSPSSSPRSKTHPIHPKAHRHSLSKRHSIYKKKPKKIAKTGPAYNAIPEEHDDRFDDEAPAPVTAISRGGAPRNELADRLVISCFLKDKPHIDKNHRFRCIASALCKFALINTKRQLDRILKHSIRCPVLRHWKPELYTQAEIAFARRAASAKLLSGDSGSSKEVRDIPIRFI